MDQDQLLKKYERLQLIVNNMGLLIESLQKEVGELKSPKENFETEMISNPDFVFYSDDYDEVFEG